jgi:hypothetical protein
MAEEPEHVLPEQRAPVLGCEELGTRLAVEQKQRRGGRDGRQSEYEQDRVSLDRPHEERNAHPRHPRRAHIVDRDDEVDRARERGDRREMDGEDPEVLAAAGAALA